MKYKLIKTDTVKSWDAGTFHYHRTMAEYLERRQKIWIMLEEICAAVR